MKTNFFLTSYVLVYYNKPNVIIIWFEERTTSENTSQNYFKKDWEMSVVDFKEIENVYKNFNFTLFHGQNHNYCKIEIGSI